MWPRSPQEASGGRLYPETAARLRPNQRSGCGFATGSFPMAGRPASRTSGAPLFSAVNRENPNRISARFPPFCASRRAISSAARPTTRRRAGNLGEWRSLGGGRAAFGTPRIFADTSTFRLTPNPGRATHTWLTPGLNRRIPRTERLLVGLVAGNPIGRKKPLLPWVSGFP